MLQQSSSVSNVNLCVWSARVEIIFLQLLQVTIHILFFMLLFFK